MDFGQDPYPEYAWLREQEPVRRVVEGEGLYGLLITRHEDVRMLLTDPRMSKDPRNAPLDWQAAGKGRPLEDRTGLGTAAARSACRCHRDPSAAGQRPAGVRGHDRWAAGNRGHVRPRPAHRLGLRCRGRVHHPYDVIADPRRLALLRIEA